MIVFINSSLLINVLLIICFIFIESHNGSLIDSRSSLNFLKQMFDFFTYLCIDIFKSLDSFLISCLSVGFICFIDTLLRLSILITNVFCFVAKISMYLKISINKYI